MAALIERNWGEDRLAVVLVLVLVLFFFPFCLLV
jgi:hypothetical protein